MAAASNDLNRKRLGLKDRHASDAGNQPSNPQSGPDLGDASSGSSISSHEIETRINVSHPPSPTSQGCNLSDNPQCRETDVRNATKLFYGESPMIKRTRDQTEMDQFFQTIFESIRNNDQSVNALNGQWSTVSVFLDCLRDTDTLKSYITLFSTYKENIFGKVVLEIGCGIGLLGLICAKFGAKSVSAVESSPFIAIARKLAEENDCQTIMSFVISLAAIRTSIGSEPVDLIISDWIGTGFFRGNLMSVVIKARDQLMLNQASVLILPGSASLYICGISDDSYNSFHKRWKNAGDVDFTSLRLLDLKTPIYGDCIRPESVVTSSGLLHTYDIGCMRLSGIRFTSEFCLLPSEKIFAAHRSLPITGLVIYCNVMDEAGESVVISTKPTGLRNRYGQTVLCLPTPVVIGRHSELNGRFTFIPPITDACDPVFVLEYCVDGGEVKEVVYGMLDHPPLSTVK